MSARHVLEQVREPVIFLMDCEGRAVSWSPGVQRTLGWTAADWIGQPAGVAFTEDDVRVGVHDHELQTAAVHGHADSKRWMQRRSGEPLFAWGRLMRLCDNDEHLAGFLRVIVDVTPAKLEEQERERMLASESQGRSSAESRAAMLGAAFDALDEGVVLIDPHGLQAANASAMRLLGLQMLTALPIHLDELVQRCRLRPTRHGALLPDAELPLKQALQGRTVERDLWVTQADTGADIPLHWMARPIYRDSHVVGSLGILRPALQSAQPLSNDLVAQEPESASQERDAELRALTEGVRDYAIYTVDTAGRIASWHTGAQLMKGYAPEEALGAPYEMLFSPEDRAAGRPQHELDMAARDGEYKVEGLRFRKDGSSFDAAVVVTALRSPQGTLLGYLKLTQDVSARKRLERERDQLLLQTQAARAEAERANASKSEILAILSHTLRTPLSAILGWAHVLERGSSDSATEQRGLAAISRNAKLQIRLVEDLLDLSHMEAGQLRLDIQRVELGSAIAEAIAAAVPAAEAKGIALSSELGATVVAVLADPARLQQILGHLLANAIKFSSPGGQVRVALSTAEHRALITVADTGMGMEPDALARIFERIQPEKDSTTSNRRSGGLGIGLTITRGLVQLHDGHLTAHSQGAGAGASFTVSLPEAPLSVATALAGVMGSSAHTGATGAAAHNSSAAASPPRPGDAPVRLDGLNVLLVDDEADVRAVTTRMLQEAGAHVCAVTGASEALRLLPLEQPMVIISDIGMAGIDGYELIRRVRRLPPDRGGRTPAAALTAYAEPADRQHALEAGFQLHLSKPVPPIDLIKAVAALAAWPPL